MRQIYTILLLMLIHVAAIGDDRVFHVDEDTGIRLREGF